MKLIFILNWITFFSFTQASFAFGKASTCRFHYFAFDVDHLACLQQMAAVKSIGENFQRVDALKRTCQECRDLFPESSNFIGKFHSDYLPIAVDRQEFGGNVVKVIFRNDPLIYRLWLYPVEGDHFQLRSVTSEKIAPLPAKQMLEYANEELFAKFWVNAFE